ncbi:MAG: SigE family RNA polymerase sigma factor [Actinomycetota bacterium]|nr:SigE family RNA polymerase sigma factor [Actinomycetota bacterium]
MRQTHRDAEFQRFYEAEAMRLARFALLLCGDRDRAADLVQEAMLRAYRSWGRIEGDDPAPYVRRVVVNLVRNDFRKKRADRERAVPAEQAVPSHAQGVEDALFVTQALCSLSPIRRAVLVLRFYEDLSEAEVARVLDRPVGTVKSDIHRSLKRLRAIVEAATEVAKEA